MKLLSATGRTTLRVRNFRAPPVEQFKEADCAIISIFSICRSDILTQSVRGKIVILAIQKSILVWLMRGFLSAPLPTCETEIIIEKIYRTSWLAIQKSILVWLMRGYFFKRTPSKMRNRDPHRENV